MEQLEAFERQQKAFKWAIKEVEKAFKKQSGILMGNINN